MTRPDTAGTVTAAALVSITRTVYECAGKLYVNDAPTAGVVVVAAIPVGFCHEFASR
ncbi:MAG: hypothetical protein MSC30_15705 [Gaiellaceae bacterium MAG52_C11]|nr:hypothetical protein [Candidatus Gaiellasilicea maunaloa]